MTRSRLSRTGTAVTRSREEKFFATDFASDLAFSDSVDIDRNGIAQVSSGVYKLG